MFYRRIMDKILNHYKCMKCVHVVGVTEDTAQGAVANVVLNKISWVAEKGFIEERDEADNG